MNINFEELFNQVEVVEGTDKPLLDKSELVGELIELIRDAKISGVESYALVEAALFDVAKERSDRFRSELEASSIANALNAANGVAPNVPVTEAQAAERLAADGVEPISPTEGGNRRGKAGKRLGSTQIEAEGVSNGYVLGQLADGVVSEGTVADPTPAVDANDSSIA